jgi:hypothetical protein
MDGGAGDQAQAAPSVAGASQQGSGHQESGQENPRRLLKAKATAEAVRDPVTTMVLALKEIAKYLETTRDTQGIAERAAVIKAKTDVEVYKVHLVSLLGMLQGRSDFTDEEEAVIWRCWKLINDGNA